MDFAYNLSTSGFAVRLQEKDKQTIIEKKITSLLTDPLLDEDLHPKLAFIDEALHPKLAFISLYLRLYVLHKQKNKTLINILIKTLIKTLVNILITEFGLCL